MKRFTKLLGIIVIGAVIPASAFALDWKAYPDAIKAGNIIVNAGVGFGTPLYGSMSIPPLILSIDYALPIGGIPFTLGGFFGFNQSKYKYDYIAGYGYTYTYTGTAFGARLAYHPNFGVKNLDVYATFALGYYLYGAKAEYTGEWPTGTLKTSPAKYDTFYWGGNLGVRYFFTPKIGAWAELGYSALSYISAGITIKF
ncbi:MAG: hypothetical protein LBP81_01020 [Treponema sp.]|jgi:hypothetical protein|nr:hypothetical protein [Treponema sp.]